MKTYTTQQQAYIDSVAGNAHQSAVEIIGRLEAELSEMQSNFMKLDSVAMEPGRINMRVGGDGAEHLVRCLVDFYRDNDGDNFITFDVFRGDVGFLTLTMQRKNAKSPGERIAELENQLAEKAGG